MNKLYVLVPLVLTLAFGGFYLQHRSGAAAEAVRVAEAKAREAAEVAAKKAEAEGLARADAERRESERRETERKKEEEKRARWAADSLRIEADTAQFQATAAAHAEEAAALAKQLAALRIERDQAGQGMFDVEREIELARIQKRSAELEIQRLVEMVARKGGSTVGVSLFP